MVDSKSNYSMENNNYDQFNYCVRELFASDIFLSMQEKASINFILDIWEQTGRVEDNDFKKLNDIYVIAQRRKGYGLC
jgi:hypothetical protein